MASLTLFDMELDDRPIEIDTPAIFDKIERELREHLLEQSDEGDSTDGIFDILDNLTNRLQEDFDEIIGEKSDKKRFIKSLTHIFALLLYTKVDTVDKIKRIFKIAVGLNQFEFHPG